MAKKEVNNMNLEDVKERKRVTVERKMNEAPLFVETMTNNRNGERQIQINETYLPKDSEEPKYLCTRMKPARLLYWNCHEEKSKSAKDFNMAGDANDDGHTVPDVLVQHHRIHASPMKE
jgi:hypothetical protein